MDGTEMFDVDALFVDMDDAAASWVGVTGGDGVEHGGRGHALREAAAAVEELEFGGRDEPWFLEQVDAWMDAPGQEGSRALDALQFDHGAHAYADIGACDAAECDALSRGSNEAWCDRQHNDAQEKSRISGTMSHLSVSSQEAKSANGHPHNQSSEPQQERPATTQECPLKKKRKAQAATTMDTASTGHAVSLSSVATDKRQDSACETDSHDDVEPSHADMMRQIKVLTRRCEAAAKESAQLRKQLAQTRSQNRTLQAQLDRLVAFAQMFGNGAGAAAAAAAAVAAGGSPACGKVASEETEQQTITASAPRSVKDAVMQHISIGAGPSGSTKRPVLMCAVFLLFLLFPWLLSTNYNAPGSGLAIPNQQTLLQLPAVPTFGENSVMAYIAPVTAVASAERVSRASAAVKAVNIMGDMELLPAKNSIASDLHAAYLQALDHSFDDHELGKPSDFIMVGDVLATRRNNARLLNGAPRLVSFVLPAKFIGLNLTENDASFAELNCEVVSVSQFGIPVSF
ncbi:hypothetical protein FVE85_2519 [Porphyridium purpureum]|uniref:Uncharacterized protein n=1 Tax=Porphyridium purpureum TaxID=35688 RepID=A0A5J4YLD7_PORPP|nr:hypothetical protein FVE85_2519 [Porphyridium purpureum]|eukprot:POR5718..scf291_13